MPNPQNSPAIRSSLPSNQANDSSRESVTISHDSTRYHADQVALSVTRSEQNIATDQSTIVDHVDGTVISLDLWSAAYREAVETLGEDIDLAILKGKNIEQLFKELGEIDNETTQESAFLRGVRYLQSIQVPLERFKLVLDLASPLTSLDPAASTVFGVVRGVTAVSSIHLYYSSHFPMSK